MNKIQKTIVALTIFGAVGVSYALYTLNGLPESFDWDEDDDE